MAAAFFFCLHFCWKLSWWFGPKLGLMHPEAHALTTWLRSYLLTYYKGLSQWCSVVSASYYSLTGISIGIPCYFFLFSLHIQVLCSSRAGVLCTESCVCAPLEWWVWFVIVGICGRILGSKEVITHLLLDLLQWWCSVLEGSCMLFSSISTIVCWCGIPLNLVLKVFLEECQLIDKPKCTSRLAQEFWLGLIIKVYLVNMAR